jgi:hypothetical protein
VKRLEANLPLIAGPRAMKVITLDALGWQSPRDFYAALLPELEAPAWHGRNLDALNDSLNSGGINGVEPS